MPPAIEYVWTLRVRLSCPATLKNPDGVEDVISVIGVEKAMTDKLKDIKDNGLRIQTGVDSWAFYPAVVKVEISRSVL